MKYTEQERTLLCLKCLVYHMQQHFICIYLQKQICTQVCTVSYLWAYFRYKYTKVLKRMFSVSHMIWVEGRDGHYNALHGG